MNNSADIMEVVECRVKPSTCRFSRLQISSILGLSSSLEGWRQKSGNFKTPAEVVQFSKIWECRQELLEGGNDELSV